MNQNQAGTSRLAAALGLCGAMAMAPAAFAQEVESEEKAERTRVELDDEDANAEVQAEVEADTAGAFAEDVDSGESGNLEGSQESGYDFEGEAETTGQQDLAPPTQQQQPQQQQQRQQAQQQPQQQQRQQAQQPQQQPQQQAGQQAQQQQPGAAAAQGQVQGIVQELKQGEGEVSILAGQDEMTLQARPHEIAGLNEGDSVSLSYETFGGNLWLSSQPQQQGQQQSSPAQVYSQSSTIQGQVGEMDKNAGTLTVQGRQLRAHPEDLQQLTPGQFVSVSSAEVEGTPWVQSIQQQQQQGAQQPQPGAQQQGAQQPQPGAQQQGAQQPQPGQAGSGNQ